VAVEDMDAGDLSREVWISMHLDFQAAQGNFKVRREPGFVSVSTGEEIFLGHISLILPDIYIVKLCSIAGLYLDLLGHFSVGIDPVAFECAKDGIEAALFHPEPAFQALDHIPMVMRILKMQIE
jgi:hypothetical protein